MMEKGICKDCKNQIKTKEAHSGNFNEIREYKYCKTLYMSDDDLDWVVGCEAFEPNPKNDELIQQAKQSLSKGAKSKADEMAKKITLEQVKNLPKDKKMSIG